MLYSSRIFPEFSFVLFCFVVFFFFSLNKIRLPFSQKKRSVFLLDYPLILFLLKPNRVGVFLNH